MLNHGLGHDTARGGWLVPTAGRQAPASTTTQSLQEPGGALALRQHYQAVLLKGGKLPLLTTLPCPGPDPKASIGQDLGLLWAGPRHGMVGGAREITSRRRPKLVAPYHLRFMVLPSTLSRMQATPQRRASRTPATPPSSCSQMGQVVTTIFPPLFVWADARYLTGAWCVWATTYNEDAQSCITMVDIVQA